MKTFSYDLHIHSCLSPCGDNDMTVCNIAGMAYIKGLEILALTDHNTCKNTSAFFAACERYGIIPVAGMELTTAEEIHLLCLFPTLEAALRFEDDFQPYRLKIKNKTEIFGDQLILDENDEVTGVDEYLLPPATMLSLDEAVSFVRDRGGACLPAHIDRPANGIIGVLGMLPKTPWFGFVELHDGNRANECGVGIRRMIVNSDAHRLEDISEADNEITLDVDDGADGDTVRAELIRYLRCEESYK